MSDGIFLRWGMLVTAFLLIAFLLTVRQLFENNLAEREERRRNGEKVREVAESNSGL